MLNIIWPLFIIISFIYAFFSGNIENVSNGIFTSLTEVVNLCLTFLGTMCLWNGIMEIAKRTTLIRKLTIFFRPLINFLFPELKENEQFVLNMRFGLEDGRAKTLEEVGQAYGVTRERIRQIEVKALGKLRKSKKAKYLREYLIEG